MRRATILLGSVLGCLGAWASGVAGSEAKIVPAAVVCAGDASLAERLAAGEIRRYVYLRTGRLLPVVDRLETASGGLIVVGSKSNKLVRTVLEPRPGANDRSAVSVQDLGPEQYLLADSLWKDRPILVVAGGDPIGTLYGAYRLAEHLGVRFYLHGDVIPDQKTPLALPAIHELGKPLFDRRGIQPFHDFPEGPDWWNLDAYEAHIGQLPKLRMNFFGLHTYLEGGVGPEPLTWIGTPDQIAGEGRVKASYPARHFTAASGTWGYGPMKTGNYDYGASALFDRDDFGDRRSAGGHRRASEGQAAFHTSHLRLGARPASAAGALRPVPACGDAHELHQPAGGE